jgi:hypothetical protein
MSMMLIVKLRAVVAIVAKQCALHWQGWVLHCKRAPTYDYLAVIIALLVSLDNYLAVIIALFVLRQARLLCMCHAALCVVLQCPHVGCTATSCLAGIEATEPLYETSFAIYG